MSAMSCVEELEVSLHRTTEINFVAKPTWLLVIFFIYHGQQPIVNMLYNF